jgi:SAM-dependent methyltransferase
MDPIQTAAFGVIAAAAVAVYFFFSSFAFGAGYQPAPQKVVDEMMALAEVGPADTVYDLGAGTGAIVFAAARRYHARAVGVEVEPIRMLILWLRRQIGGPKDRVRLKWGNLHELDFHDASVVAVFLWPGAMQKLKSQLERQLSAGSRVVSHWHQVPGWKWERFDPTTHVFLYRWEGSGASGC